MSHLLPGSRGGDAMKSPYARGQPFLAGETITGGEFECRKCGYRIECTAGEVRNLPVCPRCRHDQWKPA